MTDDYSVDNTQMQSTTDPGEVGTESKATTLAGELERLRFAVKELKQWCLGTIAQWYESPTAQAVLSEDARTNSVATGLTVTRTTTGVPAAGIGTRLLLRGESADEAPSDFAALDAVATDVTAGSEDTVLDLLLRVAGAALSAAFRFTTTTAFRAIFSHANTADRTYTLPDKDGTLAFWTFVRKTADEIVNNSTTLQNDDALLAALAANEVVAFQCAIHLTSGVTPDIKVAFTVPSGATLRWGMVGNADPSINQTSVGASGTGILAQTAGVALPGHILLSGTVVNGANAGNLQLQWAQNTADASDTTVLANSWLLVIRV